MSVKVSFKPTKSLFIDTLTKDINITDCILDLVDNSVDSYTRHNLRDTKSIIIDFSENNFSIYDSCGGISTKELTEEVFRFGSEEILLKKPTIGLYGIGLKRAIFKLGKDIIFETDDGKNYSKLELDTDVWKKNDNWELPLSSDSGKSKLKAKGLPYTRITINKLREETKELFSGNYASTLIKTLEIYYTLYLENKIKIEVNKVPLNPYDIQITTYKGSKPRIIDNNFNGLKVKTICWIHLKSEGRKRSSRLKFSKGWQVFMNKRLVLTDDTSSLTGWSGNSSELPKYHPIFNEFRGLVFLTTNNPSQLPINTSKNGFNIENKTYNQVFQQMVATAKPIIHFLNSKYENDKYELDQKEKSIEASIENDEAKETNKLSLKLELLPLNQEFKPPVKYTLMLKPQKDEITIKYKKSKKLVEVVKKKLKVKTNEEVGIKTFDYYTELEEIL